MFSILHVLAIFIVSLFKSRSRLEAENLFLRHLSLPKIRSGLDSHDRAESSHR